MNDLYNALIERGDNPEEAQSLIREMRLRVTEGEDPEDVLADEGLEPDFVLDLL